MVKIHLLALICIICIWAGRVYGAKGEKAVAVILDCRHSDRAIFNGYGTDPFRFAKYWPEGFGQLTEFGRQRHRELGRILRKRYPHLTGTAKKIFVQSSNRTRTQESAKANLQGLYPSSPNSIAVNVIPTNKDHFLLMSESCPRHKFLLSQYMKENRYRNIMKYSQPMMRRLQKLSGDKQKTITDNWKLFDTLHVELLNGLNIPKWAKNEMREGSDLRGNAMFFYGINTPKEEMKMLRSGYFLKQILDQAADKVYGKLSQDFNVWIYFGHDTTIASLMDSLGIFHPPHVPPYASCLIFEIFQGINEPYIKLVYLKSPTDLKTQHIHPCGEKCTIKEWRKIYDNILPKKSFTEACKLRKGNKLPKHEVIP